MTIMETKELLKTIDGLFRTKEYPEQEAIQQRTLNVWEEWLRPYNKDDVMLALRTYCVNNHFPPSLGDLLPIADRLENYRERHKNDDIRKEIQSMYLIANEIAKENSYYLGFADDEEKRKVCVNKVVRELTDHDCKLINKIQSYYTEYGFDYNNLYISDVVIGYLCAIHTDIIEEYKQERRIAYCKKRCAVYDECPYNHIPDDDNEGTCGFPSLRETDVRKEIIHYIQKRDYHNCIDIKEELFPNDWENKNVSGVTKENIIRNARDTHQYSLLPFDMSKKLDLICSNKIGIDETEMQDIINCLTVTDNNNLCALPMMELLQSKNN